MSPQKCIGYSRRRGIILPLIAVFLLLVNSFRVHYDLEKHYGNFPDHVLDDFERFVRLKSLRLKDLKSVHQSHGRFYFGPHSHLVHTPQNETVEHPWMPAQEMLLHDEEIDVERERERCAAYKLGLPGNTTTPRRRRLFLGSLLADDSVEVLKAVGAEARNIFHSVAYVESNVTHTVHPRKWRYLEDGDRPSQSLHQLYQLFGPRTKVSVDYYITHRERIARNHMLTERLQREGITHRWRMNGMRPDDVGIVADTDETFTRDFLRVLQICDIPQFRKGQDCQRPIIAASTLVFESSGECITKGRRWFHPEAISGQCVDLIGNDTLHPPAKREWPKKCIPKSKLQKPVWGQCVDSIDNDPDPQITYGERLKGYGRGGNYSLVDGFPLWSAVDIRVTRGGASEREFPNANWAMMPTGYHFHNFFTSAHDIHFKYSTYGHGEQEAMSKPIWEIHPDLELAVRCARGGNINGIESFDNLDARSDRPIYFLNDEVRKKRHLAWQSIVKEEEENYTQTIKSP